MEWDGLDQALPNEIAKFDQAQVARLRSQLLHQSNYHHQTKAATNKASCTMLKEIIGELIKTKQYHFKPESLNLSKYDNK